METLQEQPPAATPATEMNRVLLPSTLGRIALPEWQFPPHIQALQEAVLDTLYDPIKNRLIVEIPVRHGKSYYTSFVLPSWRQMVRPNWNTWVMSYGSEFATEWSWRIRKLIDEFGHITGTGIDPTFKSRDHFRMAPPHTGDLRGLGITGGIAGKGAHLIIVDDPVKEMSEVATEEARDKLYTRFHAEVLNRLEPGGKMIIVMSRRHPDDLSGRLLDSNEELAAEEQWHRIKFPALSEDETVALWPERYPVKRLLGIRNDYRVASKGYLWDCLFQQDPATAAELCEWPASYWKNLYYTERPPFTPRFRLLSLDPAKGKDRRKGDYSALLLGLVDSQGTLWIDQPILVRVPVSQLEALSVAVVLEHRPDAFSVECNMFQEVVADNITKLVPTAPIYKYDSREHKEVRIRMLLDPLVSRGNLRIRDTPQGRILGQQLRDFPEAGHDDGPDSLALMVRLWRDLLGGGHRQSGGDQPLYTN